MSLSLICVFSVNDSKKNKFGLIELDSAIIFLDFVIAMTQFQRKERVHFSFLLPSEMCLYSGYKYLTGSGLNDNADHCQNGS